MKVTNLLWIVIHVGVENNKIVTTNTYHDYTQIQMYPEICYGFIYTDISILSLTHYILLEPSGTNGMYVHMVPPV